MIIGSPRIQGRRTSSSLSRVAGGGDRRAKALPVASLSQMMVHPLWCITAFANPSPSQPGASWSQHDGASVLDLLVPHGRSPLVNPAPHVLPSFSQQWADWQAAGILACILLPASCCRGCLHRLHSNRRHRLQNNRRHRLHSSRLHSKMQLHGAIDRLGPSRREGMAGCLHLAVTVQSTDSDRVGGRVTWVGANETGTETERSSAGSGQWLPADRAFANHDADDRSSGIVF